MVRAHRTSVGRGPIVAGTDCGRSLGVPVAQFGSVREPPSTDSPDGRLCEVGARPDRLPSRPRTRRPRRGPHRDARFLPFPRNAAVLRPRSSVPSGRPAPRTDRTDRIAAASRRGHLRTAARSPRAAEPASRRDPGCGPRPNAALRFRGDERGHDLPVGGRRDAAGIRRRPDSGADVNRSVRCRLPVATASANSSPPGLRRPRRADCAPRSDVQHRDVPASSRPTNTEPEPPRSEPLPLPAPGDARHRPRRRRRPTLRTVQPREVVAHAAGLVPMCGFSLATKPIPNAPKLRRPSRRSGAGPSCAPVRNSRLPRVRERRSRRSRLSCSAPAARLRSGRFCEGGMRRVLSLLLIPMCLTGPARPHAHAGSEPGDHDVRPHVHVGHAHVHRHGSSTPHRHHGPKSAAHRHPRSGGGRAGWTAPRNAHDADSLYLTQVVVTARGREAARPVDGPNATGCPSPVFSVGSAPRGVVTAPDPPDPFGGRPIFLRTASLRL